MATTDAAGSVSARATLTTVSVPTFPCGFCAITSLVTYSHRPSGEIAMPTGAIPTGMVPTKSPGPKPWVSARCRLNTATRRLSSWVTNA